MPIPGYQWHFPGKDEVADYLETYARTLDLPVREAPGWTGSPAPPVKLQVADLAGSGTGRSASTSRSRVP